LPQPEIPSTPDSSAAASDPILMRVMGSSPGIER
jgi:hypothetical protein